MLRAGTLASEFQAGRRKTDHAHGRITHRPRVRRSGSNRSLYPEEIRYLNRPVTKDADQPACVHCRCAFAEHCAGRFVGACRKCNCRNYNRF